MARDILTPVSKAPAKKLGAFSLRYRKQILPERDIIYTDDAGQKRTLKFDDEYLQKLANSFKEISPGKAVPFVLAGKDNEHNMAPENFRGKVEKVELAQPGEQPGLYATMAFPNRRTARAVMDNPDLGVSVRIKEDVELSDGRHYDAALIHVLGTMDPQVLGMEPWTKVDLSGYSSEDEVIDLSNQQWKETTMPKGKTKDVDLSTATAADIDDMTEEELDAVLAELADDIDAETDGDDEDDSDDDADGVSDAAGDGDDEDSDDDSDDSAEGDAQLSSKAQRLIDLANSRAQEANTRAQRALQHAADSDWDRERRDLARAGVPKAVVDLAEPFLHRVDPQVIDLSNGKKMDGSAQVRKILESMKGFINLSGPLGSNVDPDEDAVAKQKDAELLKSWNEQYPT